MELSTDFDTFLKGIRLTDPQRATLRDGHVRLRERLGQDNMLAPIFVTNFLQGSYKRYTAVRPKNDRRADVDIIVVTKLHEEEYTPQAAMNLFEPFLDRFYRGKWQFQGRSIGIELADIDFDLVITSAPSEQEYDLLKSDAVTSTEDLSEAMDWRLNASWVSLARRFGNQDARRLLLEASTQPEWKAAPLRIPDREAQEWQDTHPLQQIIWTRDKNKTTNGHFVNVVKAIKWWRLENYLEPKHPKGFPLERIVGDCCPDGITSVAHGIVLTLENIVSKYKYTSLLKGTPELPDYGVPSHNVLKRLSSEDFSKFFLQAEDGARLARSAFDAPDRVSSTRLWIQLLGSKFPSAPSDGGNTGYTPPSGPATPTGGRFA